MCGIDVCPVHTRTDAVDAIKANVPARAIEYHGDYAVATLDNPEFDNPLSALGALFDPSYEPPGMFMTLVIKVGPTGALGDVLDAGNLDRETVFRQAFLKPSDSRLEEFKSLSPFAPDTSAFNERLTEIMHESHEMVVSSVKKGLIS